MSSHTEGTQQHCMFQGGYSSSIDLTLNRVLFVSFPSHNLRLSSQCFDHFPQRPIYVQQLLLTLKVLGCE